MKPIENIIKNISHTFNKLSIWGKLLIFIILILGIKLYFSDKKNKNMWLKAEGFENTDKFIFKDTNVDIYDDFYADIYDYLVYNKIKDNYEVGEILNKTTPNEQSIILDIGSGTGNTVASLAKKNLNITGLDNSISMIDKSKSNYPDYNFQYGDAMKAETFQASSFTHILCLYFTIYYFKDKHIFFKNCFDWLKPGGYLVVHLVDRDMFDPILNAANPLITLSPQRYAKDRITTSKITFDDFKYNANFVLDSTNDNASFVEKFEDRTTGKVFRKNEHKMYMQTEGDILNIAEQTGFIYTGKIDLIKAAYDYQYLYMFTKPN